MKSPLLLLLFLFPSFLFAQTAKPLVLSGTLTYDGNKPVPYASLALSDGKTGTFSNEEGAFRLVVPQGAEGGSLRISHISFEPVSLKLSEFEPGIEISLQQKDNTFQKVLITGVTGDYVLREALKRLPENHRAQAFRSKGFYRLTTQKHDRYIHLSEAVFEQYHPTADKERDQFKLDRIRSIRDKRIAETLSWSISAEDIFELDLINHLDAFDLLNKKGLKMHDFRLVGEEMWEDRKVYRLAFDQQDGLKVSGYAGQLFIDQENYAFLGVNMGLSKKGLPYKKYGTALERAVIRALGVEVEVELEGMQIRYREVDGQYCLSHAFSDTRLVLRSPRNQFDFPAYTKLRYIATEIDAEGAHPFAAEEALGMKKSIEWQEKRQSEDFWEDQNILLPEADFEAIAAEMDSVNQANELKRRMERKLADLPKDKALRIDSILSFYHAKGNFNGVALVEQGGNVLHHKAYNNAQTQNTLQSRFRIGSTSKTFMGMLVMRMVAEGKVTVHDPIWSALPNYPHHSSQIFHLLTHQSGLRNCLDDDAHLLEIMSKRKSLEELVRDHCSDPLAYMPGHEFRYSNSGYMVLALWMERMKGKAFAEVLREEIWNPLGMSATCLGTPKDSAEVVTGFMYGAPEPSYPIENVTGAGGVTTTAEDLLKWSRGLDRGDLLNAEYTQEMYKPRVDYTDWDAYYGYGWMTDKFMFSVSRDHAVHYHPGTDFGFQSMFVKVPGMDATLILLCNTGEFPRYEMTDLILGALD